MAIEQIDELTATNAFLPSPLTEDLAVCHVPFESLVAGSRVESALDDRVRRGLAIALIGPSGAGKSGVTAFTLGRVTTDFAQIHVPVSYERDEVVREPGNFARYLLQRLLAEAERVDALRADERNDLLQQASERLVASSRTVGRRVGGALQLPWLLKGEVARDVAVTIGAAELRGPVEAALQAVDRTVEAIYAHGLVPIIVLDDTDRWLRVGETDRSALIGDFFGRVTRMLAERACALVVAVHTSYLELEAYRSGTRGFLTDAIELPALPSPDALAAILAHRVRLQLEDVPLEEIVEPSAVERLFEYYCTTWRFSLRWVLQATHEALTEAAATRADRLSVGLIDDAAAAYAL
jgi:hypothetical protein